VAAQYERGRSRGPANLQRVGRPSKPPKNRKVVRRNLYNLSIGVRPLILIQDNPAIILTIANTGAMLSVGQKRSKEIAALAVEQVVIRF
jgi:hypothetical protein